MILLGYVFSLLYAALCLGLGFLVSQIPRCSKKITRKLVHILIGFEWLILYHYFGTGIHFLLVCLFFLAVLAIAYKKKLMAMISSDGDNAPGTVYYALAMSIMALICIFVPDMMLPFGIGVLCTSLGDGFAGLFGQFASLGRNAKIYGNKTIYGTMMNFIVCFCSVGVFQREFNLGLTIVPIISIALFSTILELLSTKGLDNISVTLGSSFLAYAFISFPAIENYIVPILMTPVIIVLAYKKKALTVSGIIAAIAIDFVVSLSLGNSGFVMLLAFFIGGIVVDKIKKKSEKTGQNIEKRGDCRDHVQVLANAFVPSLCAVLYAFTFEKLYLIAFVAALAEALADTTASGIGAFSKRVFDPFRMRACTPGISGGMSWLGTVSSALAALLMSCLAYLLDILSINGAVIVFASAFIGGIFDSMLGSLIQVKYRCPKCSRIVEREEHCGESCVRHSGLPFVTNDMVNLFSTLFASLLSILLYFL